jgi:hypothetical protein
VYYIQGGGLTVIAAGPFFAGAGSAMANHSDESFLLPCGYISRYIASSAHLANALKYNRKK